MIRVIPAAEHNLQVDPPNPLTLANNTATELIKNQVGDRSGEIAFRYIQNTGSNPIYYTLGDNSTNPVCSPSVYHGIIPVGGQLDCSSTRVRVVGYAAGGSTVGITIVRRIDLAKTQNLVNGFPQ